VGGIWQTTPTELELGISDTQVLSNVSLDINSTGTIVCIGIPNANNAEGLVQIWKKVSGVWAKDLHLGSPSPSPTVGAFGYAVAISDDGNRLFTSELGNNAVHIYNKGSIWSATPADTLIGTNRFGYGISCTGDGNTIVVSAIDSKIQHIFSLSTTWNNTQNISYGKTSKLSKSGTYLLVGDSDLGTAKIYTYGTSYTLTKTLTNTDSFGFSVDINNSGNVIIGNPLAHKAHYYTITDNYTTPVEYISTTLTGLDFYGYSVTMSDISFVITNYYDNVLLITSDTASIPQSIFKTRQNYAEVALSTNLNTTEPQILSFYSSVPLSISNVGKTKADLGLNGIVYGWLLFNKILSNTEITNIEDLVRKYLKLNKYSLYEN
jgi:hypothetical protein